MKATILGTIFPMLILSFMLYGVAVVKADLIGTDGITAAYKPYIVFPSRTSYDSKSLTLNVSFHAVIGGKIKYSMTYS